MIPERKVWVRDAVLVLICALIFRAGWFMDAGRPMSGDEPAYHDLAVSLGQGKGFVTEAGEPTAFRTPGLPLALAAIYRVVGEDVSRARVVLIAVTSLTAPVLYGLCLLVFQRRLTAWLAALAWAVSPTSRWFAGTLLGEPLAALCLTAGLLLVLIAGQRRSIGWAVAAGLLISYAVFIRFYLLLGLIGPVAWFVSRRQRALAVAVACSSLLLLGGWGARNLVRMGTFTLSTETSPLWLGNNAWARGSWYGYYETQVKHFQDKYPGFDGLGEVAQAKLYVREAVHEVAAHPGRIAWLLPRKVAILFSPSSWMGFDWLWAVLLPCAALGMWTLARDSARRHAYWVLGVPIIGIIIVGLVTFGEPRFRHPVDPLLWAFAAAGLAKVVSAWRERIAVLEPVAR